MEQEKNTFNENATSQRPSWAVTGLVWLAYVAILVSRRSELLFDPAVWAEDSEVFFHQAHQMGWASIWHAHTGYIHLVPRTIACMATGLPLAWTAHFYIYSTLIVWAAIGFFILQSRLPVSNPIKALMVLSIVLVPHGGEVWINLKNIQWIVSLTLLVIMLEETPTSRARASINVMIWTIAALTGPFILIFLPVMMLKWWWSKRTQYTYLLAIIAVGCTVIHLTSYVMSGRYSSIKVWNPNYYLWFKTGYAYLSGFFNVEPDQKIMVVPVLVGWLTLVAVFIRGLIKAESNRRSQLFMLFGCGAIVLAITFYEFRDTLFIRPLGVENASGGPRYSFIPFICLMWALLLLAHQKRSLTSMPGVLCLLVICSTLFGGHFESIMPYEPTSLEQLQDYSKTSEGMRYEKGSQMVGAIKTEGD